MMTFQSPQAGRTACGKAWHVRANSIPPLLRREKNLRSEGAREFATRKR